MAQVRKSPPIKMPPGIVLTQTESEAQGRFISCDHVRFAQGQPEKIGGWEKWNEDGDELTGICRSILAWQDFSFNTWFVFGTVNRLWVFDQDKVRTNITPFSSTGTLTDPFSTTNGSTTVTVADTGHGRNVGDIAIYDGATAVGGITIDGEYTVQSVIDADSYTITHSSAATSTAGPGGGTVDFSYELAPGSTNVTYGGGWGLGRWGEGTWGTARASITYTQLPRHWSLDKYGQYLIASPSGGGLYQWQLDVVDRAEIVTNAPTSSLYMFVTSERIVVMLGTGDDFLRMEWCDDDDITDWTPAPDNLANFRRLQEGSRLVAGARLGQGVNAIWTDTAVYLMQFTGTNSVYATSLRGTNCGLVGPRAFVCVDGVAYWISGSSFYMFAGGAVSQIPNSQDVESVFDDIDAEQRFKITCWFNPEFREIWWHYPSSGANEPDKYVMVCLEDFSWVTGTLDRTCFGVLSLLGQNVILATSETGIIYQHETGTDDDGDALDWHLESAFFDAMDGNMGVNIDGYVPDWKRLTGTVDLTFSSIDQPESPDTLDTATDQIDSTTEIVDLRHYGRLCKFRIEQEGEVGGDFRLGAHRIELSYTPTKRQR